ncbi:hypothetical protein DO72_4253 [Burkholderia pseudomallei]|nr:hypothetical protein DO72_4253 [Burkholderia pseudomallei]KOT19291.1 hypothetical protein DM52_689 [Burkholderia mallei]
MKQLLRNTYGSNESSDVIVAADSSCLKYHNCNHL